MPKVDTWIDATLSTEADIQAWEANVLNWGISSAQLTTRRGRAKDMIAREIRTRRKDLYSVVDTKTEEASDLVTTASSAVITSASSTFQTLGVDAGDEVLITSGDDIGRYIVSTVDLETQITLTENLANSASSIKFYIEKDILDLILNKSELRDLSIFLTLRNLCNELRKEPEDFFDIKFNFYNEQYTIELQRSMNALFFDIDEDELPDRTEKAAISGQSAIYR